jgi:hypothetical protein
MAQIQTHFKVTINKCQIFSNQILNKGRIFLGQILFKKGQICGFYLANRPNGNTALYCVLHTEREVAHRSCRQAWPDSVEMWQTLCTSVFPLNPVLLFYYYYYYLPATFFVPV